MCDFGEKPAGYEPDYTRARNPARIQPQDIVERVFEGFVELAGDGRVGYDRCLRGGLALLDGAPVRSVARKRFARRVAVVRQERTFAFPMSCLDLAMTGRTPYLGLIGGVGGRERAMALEALERVGARKLANASFEEISGGEKQRVMLARALLQEPGALLLDEAFSAMDERRAASAMRLVRELARERNMAVLSIMHDLHIAHAMTDRLVLMEEGRIVAEGTPDEAVGSEAMRRLTGMRIEVHENGSLTTCVLPESE